MSASAMSAAARAALAPSTSGTSRSKDVSVINRRGVRVSAIAPPRCVSSTSSSAERKHPSSTSRRSALLGAVAGASTLGFSLATARPSLAADVASFVSLDAIIKQVRDASDELALVEEALQTSVRLGTEPPLREMKKRLSSGAIADLPAAATRLDRFIDAPDLEDWEQAVWSSVSEQTRGSRDIDSVTGKRLGNVERTNDFLCFVFSCFNDPRAPPSTDALLSLRLLSDGVAMGLRGDDRITAEGLTYSVEDVREKLDAYVDVVTKSRLSLAAVRS